LPHRSRANDFKCPGEPLIDRVKPQLSFSPTLTAGILAFAAGCAFVALNSVGWYYSQRYLAAFDQGSVISMIVRYYLFEVVAICVVAGGAYMIYRGLRKIDGAESDSVTGILAEALRSRRDVRIGILAAVVYALVYLFVSSVVVFQPTVNFAAVYGVNGPGWDAAACCGSPGTVPALVIYLLPQAHLALQVLPLDALFAVAVPLLVGLNVTVASHALRNRILRANAGWLGSLGVMAGLFTGCPTCAGLFLAGTIGGLGATSLAVALAPYQILFVMLSIPLLVASPILVALNARRTMRAACAIPTGTKKKA